MIKEISKVKEDIVEQIVYHDLMDNNRILHNTGFALGDCLNMDH